MAEVFAVATMRCLPSVHPVFKVTPYSFLFCLHLSAYYTLLSLRRSLSGISGFRAMRRDEMTNGDKRERECVSTALIPKEAYTSDSSGKGVKILFLCTKHRYTHSTNVGVNDLKIPPNQRDHVNSTTDSLQQSLKSSERMA